MEKSVSLSISEKQLNQQLIDGMVYADCFINRQYLNNIDVHPVVTPQVDKRFLRLFKIDKLVCDPKENNDDKQISVYGALHSIESTVFVMIHAEKGHADFYLGTSCKESSTAGKVMEEAMKGNFPGIMLTSLEASKIQELLHDQLMRQTADGHFQNVSSVTLVPSLRDKEKEKSVQGLEKFIDTMSKYEYTVILLAQPLHQQTIEVKKRGFEELYSTISPFAETSLSYGNNASEAVSKGTATSFSESINNSITNSNSETTSTSSSSTSGTSSNYGFSGDGFSGGGGSSSSSTETYGSSSTWSQAVTKGNTQTRGTSEQSNVTTTIGENRTLTIKHQNKSVQNLMKHIEHQLERILQCEAFGLWNVAGYIVSPDIQTCVIGASTLRALLAGDETHMENSYINLWSGINSAYVENVLQSLSYAKHPIISLPRANQYRAQQVKPTVMISGKELPLFLGLPHQSVPGLVVDYMASFGRDVFHGEGVSMGKSIELGCILHKGEKQTGSVVQLGLEEFRSHCFITGSTGSGKSNTTYHLLQQMVRNSIPFLVVEPAKGEYKYAFAKLEKINIFWTNRDGYQLLRLNPFSFPKGIHVLEHMDRLIEIFNACWPLYSAMPAILKAGVERAYISRGWDLLHSRRLDIGGNEFPTFEDLLRELPKVIDESSYSADTKGDYIGALVTRVTSMTNGIMGSVFCSGMEISNEVLFQENTIVDLSRVGAAETKSLLMGILVMKLNEFRMSEGLGMNLPLRHITVLEEAHHLLRRTSKEQSAESANAAGKSVEMISNSIAEMRTYGEGFIIVDQSPTAVDISAIKNTNTKIVMRLPERADFETIGGSFALDDAQIREISRLGRGSAIVSQSGWLNPVMVAICKASDCYEDARVRVQGEPVRPPAVLTDIITKVWNQIDNQAVMILPIKKLLKESSLPEARKEAILASCKKLEAKQRMELPFTRIDRAEFVVDVLECKALAQVFQLVLKPGQPDALEKYANWKKCIMAYLDQYIELESEQMKEMIAVDLLVYMTFITKDPRYIVTYASVAK